MKKLFLTMILSLTIATGAFALNVYPDTVSLNRENTYGVYQVDHSIVIYKEPDDNSPIKTKIVWDKENVIPNDLKLTDLFVVYSAPRDLALMAVTDETDDRVEVIYNQRTGEKGWIKKDDPYKFSPWINFYSMYGKKYGLKVLKGAPESVNNMYGSTEDGAKVISTMNKPEIINLNVIRGNWMLVTVVDADRTPKTGFIRWRSDDGVKYLFPKFE